MNGDGSLKTYLDMIILKMRVKFSFSYPQFVQIAYTENKLVMCKLNIDSAHRQESGYWKLDKSILTSEVERHTVTGLRS